MEFLDNILHIHQRIHFTMLPTGKYVMIGEKVIVFYETLHGATKAMNVVELAYQVDPNFSPMTVS